MDDPLHCTSTPDLLWTTVNTSEALPGVQSPLGASFWDSRFEPAIRGAFADMGVIPMSEVRFPRSVAERHNAMVLGRYACNVNRLCFIANRIPGTSSEELQMAYIGAVSPTLPARAVRTRYPIVFIKLPWTAWRAAARLKRLRLRIEKWRLASIRPEALDTLRGCQAILAEALDNFQAAMRLHASTSFIAQPIFAQIARLCVEADNPGAEKDLVTGYGSLEETLLLNDLWDLSRGCLDKRVFLDRHGYHGPAEGDMSSHTWRELSEPLDQLVELYRKLAEGSAPKVLEAQRVSHRQSTERKLLNQLSKGRRTARILFALGRHFIPLRELGKATFLQTIDVGRASARALGGHLARSGALSFAEDVFYLTVDEVMAPNLPSNASDLVRRRKIQRNEYRTLQIPKLWQGEVSPALTSAEDRETVSGEVRGLGVSPGTVQAPVRVVTDLNDADIEAGEILVCEATDPGWAPLFLVASGLIIDIGGPLSHGAIVARELGIPCIINTTTGTTTLKSGDVVLLDGNTGVATRLA